jgi:FkbM family methyltransferase
MLKDLVFDVGLHDGADTAYYLECGFRVVAVDANPAMIEKAKKDFPKEVASNRLVLLNIAIAERAGESRFWISDKSEWSSFHECVSKRQGTLAEPVTVRCELLSTILQKYGIPFYLKIDIEGNDAICIRALSEIGPGARPRYVSWEATYPGGIDQLRELRDLGYTRFKIIRQNDFLPVLGPPYSFSNRVGYAFWRAVRKALKVAGRYTERPSGSSGPFGKGTLGRWRGWEEVAKQLRDYCARTDLPADDAWSVWYDFHARRY